MSGRRKRVEITWASVKIHACDGKDSHHHKSNSPRPVVNSLPKDRINSVAAVKLGADFQQTMGKVATLTNTTAAQLPSLSKGLLDEAHKVPFSAQQLAQGLYTVGVE